MLRSSVRLSVGIFEGKKKTKEACRPEAALITRSEPIAGKPSFQAA